MSSTNELAELRREVRQQRRWLARLARAFCTHTRTDLAPDAALPEMKKLAREIARGTASR